MTKQEIMEAVEIFIDYGCTNIKAYSLVNNYGYTFDYMGKHYDARFWANCYGVALNRWEIDGSNNNEALKEIENLLNEKCR